MPADSLGGIHYPADTGRGHRYNCIGNTRYTLLGCPIFASIIEKQSSQAMTTDMFISLVRKHTRARKLTPGCWASWLRRARFEKIGGVWPIPDVTVNTRKGVFVNYIPSTIAG